MKKSEKEYKRLFEDLLDYTDFTSADDIQSKEDLFNFFEQVQDDSRSKGRYFNTSSRLFKAVSGIIFTSRRTGEKIESTRSKALKSKRSYKSYKEARQRNAIIRFNNKEAFQTKVKYKGKEVSRFRDAKGRFVKVPKFISKKYKFGGNQNE